MSTRILTSFEEGYEYELQKLWGKLLRPRFGFAKPSCTKLHVSHLRRSGLVGKVTI